MFGRRQDSMNSKCYVFSSYKQRNKVPLVFLEWQLQQDRLWFMHFQVENPENGRENIFRDKQTTKKVPLIFLNVKVFTER